MLFSVLFYFNSKCYYNKNDFTVVFHMATTWKFDFAVDSNRSAVQKDPWFILVSDIDFHRAWKKKKQANQQLVIPNKLKLKKNAQMIKKSEIQYCN